MGLDPESSMLGRAKRFPPLLRWAAMFSVICTVIVVGGYFAIYRFFRATFGQPNNPEIQMLSKAISPDGRMEARLVRVIGGSGFGGAVVWQEIQIAPIGSEIKILAGNNQPGLALSVVQDSEIPIAELTWGSSNRLLVKSDKLNSVNKPINQVLGVSIDYK